MLNKLALKELREAVWIVAPALLAWLFLVMVTTGAGLGRGPAWSLISQFTGSDTINLIIVVGACMAIGLGLRQTLGESSRGTFQFLLNRPVGRRRLIGAKLVVGAGAYLLLAATPLLFIGWWAKTPGNMPEPFAWSMIAGPWKAWLALTILYFGAFLSGLRPGRWYATRFLPLLACLFLTAAAANAPFWWVAGLPAILLIDALLVANIFFVAETRDFS